MIADSLNLDIFDVLQRDVHVLRQLGGQPVLDRSQGVQVHQVLDIGLHRVQTRSGGRQKLGVHKLISVLNMNRLGPEGIEKRVDKEVVVGDQTLQLDVILARLEGLRARVEVREVLDSVRGAPVVLIFIKYSPFLILRQDDVHLPLPVFPL